MIVTCWLLKRFGSSVIFVLLAMTALLTMFDLLAHANEVTAEQKGLFLPLFYYVLLRIPPILVFILPFAVLIASLQTFASLAAHQEIVSLQAAGCSIYRIVAIFVAAVAVASVAQFYFADRIVTATVARLAEWEANAYRGLPKPELFPDKPKWFGSGNYIVHMDDVSLDGTLLNAPTLIWRNEKGMTIRYLEAKYASYVNGTWVLTEATERNLVTTKIQSFESLPVSIDLLPLHFAFLNREPEVLRFSELMILGSGKVETQIQTSRYYLVAAWRRLAQPLGAAVMVLLAAPVGLQLSRQGNRILFTVFALTMGFFFFIVERVLLTLGETGELPVALAVWGPPALFGLVGLSCTIHQQK
jgi:lipopolysaccharide export system permease protein